MCMTWVDVEHAGEGERMAAVGVLPTKDLNGGAQFGDIFQPCHRDYAQRQRHGHVIIIIFKRQDTIKLYILSSTPEW